MKALSGVTLTTVWADPVFSKWGGGGGGGGGRF